MTKTFHHLAAASSLILLLSSCSNNYAVSTNLDKENFRDYFSASKVKIYQKEAQIEGDFKLIGLVEGDDCQRKAHLSAPDEINARTHARQTAFEKGANGIIFTSCIDIETKSCVAQVVCYGKMYQVELPEEKSQE